MHCQTSTAMPGKLLSLLAGAIIVIAMLLLAPPVGALDVVVDCSPTNAGDCQALIELFNSAGGPAWTHGENWLSGSPCDATNGWYGITCTADAASGEDRVTGINLSMNNLAGPLPESVLNMEALDHLYLADNQLSGQIPQVTRSNSPLTYLGLTNNAFEGEIPLSLSELPNLLFLYLNGNILRGAVPSELCALTPVASLDGNFSLNYNALDIDPAASDVCLDAVRDTGWRGLQTIPPQPRLAEVTRQSAANGGATITVEWDPIPYSSGSGSYEALIGTTSGFAEPFAGVPADGYPADLRRTTPSKEAQDSSVTFAIPNSQQTYYIVVRTRTNADPGENSTNRNIVLSDFSEEIVNEPVALSLADFRAAQNRLPVFALLGGVLLLAAATLIAVRFWERA
jgi:hypothetical protein